MQTARIVAAYVILLLSVGCGVSIGYILPREIPNTEEPASSTIRRTIDAPVEVTAATDIQIMAFDEVAKRLTVVKDGQVVLIPSAPSMFFGTILDTGSMEPTLSGGMVILIERVADPSTLMVGDIIVFRHPVYGGSVAHRIARIGTDSNTGKWYAKTKGDANDGEDYWRVDTSFLLGVYKGYLR
jgi:signal peptidase I